MMRNKVTVLATIILTVWVISCSEGIHTSSWKAKGVDLKKYKTYAWVAPGDTALNGRRDDKLFAGTIQNAADNELRKKGMVMDVNSPDAVFMFDTHLEDRLKYSQSPTLTMGVGFGGPGYYVGGYAPVAGGQITASPYKEGFLVIEMFDLKTKQSVWRGYANKSLDDSSDITAIIQTAVHNIFVYLPIKH